MEKAETRTFVAQIQAITLQNGNSSVSEKSKLLASGVGSWKIISRKAKWLVFIFEEQEISLSIDFLWMKSQTSRNPWITLDSAANRFRELIIISGPVSRINFTASISQSLWLHIWFCEPKQSNEFHRSQVLENNWVPKQWVGKEFETQNGPISDLRCFPSPS